MCHGCFYTGSFVFDYHALYMSIEQKSHIEIFRKGSVQEFYRLKALIALEQVISSVLQKKEKNTGKRKQILVSFEKWSALTGVFFA